MSWMCKTIYLASYWFKDKWGGELNCIDHKVRSALAVSELISSEVHLPMDLWVWQGIFSIDVINAVRRPQGWLMNHNIQCRSLPFTISLKQWQFQCWVQKRYFKLNIHPAELDSQLLLPTELGKQGQHLCKSSLLFHYILLFTWMETFQRW